MTCSTESLKLNVGCGPTKLPGWIGIDRKDGGEALPLRFNDGTAVPDECADDIRMSHLLEHFSYLDVPKVLEECRRVLKPGGRLRVAVPDFEKISSVSATDPHWRFYLMGGQTDADDFHRSAFDEKLLSKYLARAGLVNVARWESPNTDTAAHPVSLNLEAFKPQPDAPESLTIKIKAIMSVPRVGWNDASQAIDGALRIFGIPMTRFNGVFWGQCMQRAFQECLNEGVDWILTLDYDSMPTAAHLNSLLKAFGTHPEIDALAALQMRRGQEYPLLTRAGETETEVTGEPLKVHTAHFGLTLIRVDALRSLPKPWFFAKPAENGDWNDDRMDDDIWFWHQWRLAGKTVYVDPNARIGHLELMVSEFDADMQPRHVPIGDWWKANGDK